MKSYFIAAATLAALNVQAQVSAPAPSGGAAPAPAGSAAGSIQQPSIAPRTAGQLPAPSPGNIGTIQSPSSITANPPAINQNAVPQPGSVSGAIVQDPALQSPPGTFRNDLDIQRARPVTPNSSDWENGLGRPGALDRGSDSGRITPPVDIDPQPRPLTGAVEGRGLLLGNPAAPVADPDRLGALGNPAITSTSITTNPAAAGSMAALDRALIAKIRAQLSHAPAPGQNAIRLAPETVRDLAIASRNGRVLMSGRVNSQQEKEAIEMQARQIQGVTSIENRIEVKPLSAGAPAPVQSGELRSPAPGSATPNPATPDAAAGQSQQNASDLNDSHPEIAPDL